MVMQDFALPYSWRFLLRKAPPFVLSLLSAEMFFRFGSFTAECLAFLVLWYALDRAYEKVSDSVATVRQGS